MPSQNQSIREHAFLDPFWLFGHPDNKTGNTGKLSCDFRGVLGVGTEKMLQALLKGREMLLPSMKEPLLP